MIKGTNIHIYPSYLTNESRIMRETKSLIRLNLVEQIEVLGFWKEGLATKDVVQPTLRLIRIPTFVQKRTGIWKVLNMVSFPVFYAKVFVRCFAKKPSVVNCHSLTVLPLGVLLKLVFKCALIYDPHELETETNDSKGLRQIVARLIEKMFIGKANTVIVVGNKIAEWYKLKYGLNNLHVIRNIPESASSTPPSTSSMRARFGLSDQDLLFIYVGVLEKGRGINLLLSVFDQLPAHYHLVFVGYGIFEATVKEAALRRGNVHVMDAVQPREVIGVISSADVGLCLIEPTCLSYYYCLPNKSFEYLRAGLPFIASNLPELRLEFGNTNVCWFSELDVDQLIGIISKISRATIEEKRNSVFASQGRWQWDEEAAKYIEIYKNLPNSE